MIASKTEYCKSIFHIYEYFHLFSRILTLPFFCYTPRHPPNKIKTPPIFVGGVFGGEDATRTHNALRHTTFPMWLLTIRIPLHGNIFVCLNLTTPILYRMCLENASLFLNFFPKNLFICFIGQFLEAVCLKQRNKK